MAKSTKAQKTQAKNKKKTSKNSEKNAFSKRIEKRIRKDIRINSLFKKGDKIYVKDKLCRFLIDKIIGDLQFINDSTGYIRAQDQYQPSVNHYILETKDTCSSWSIKTESERKIEAFSYLSYDTAYAIFWDEGRNLMKSTDAGITWEEVLFFNDKSVSSIYFNGNNIGFATASYGVDRTLYRTNDNDNTMLNANNNTDLDILT